MKYRDIFYIVRKVQTYECQCKRTTRRCLMQMINTQVIKKVGQKATLSRMAAKNAAVVKMAVKNLNNFQRISESSSNDQETNTGNGNEQNNLETASIIEIEASNKVKLLMAKFDNQ